MKKAGFRQFVLDQLETLDVTPRPMFGGTGLYAGDLFFAIIFGDALYLKVDDDNRGMFEAAGMPPFRPFPGRPATLGYYAVPLTVLEHGPDLQRWARTAIAAAAKAADARARLAARPAARSAPRATRAPAMGRAGRARKRR